MRALSIRQPWAWAICHAGKDVENRDWGKAHGYGARDVKFRGEVLVHASMRPNPTRMVREAEEFVEFCRGRGIELPDGATPGKLTANDLFRDCGGIVGIASIVDVRENIDGAPRSRWEIAGSLSLVLTDVRPLPLVSCKGALGFWTVPADVMARVDAARGVAA